MSERVESQGFYEMLWDCDHCDQKGLLANSQRHCPNCGAPQSAIRRYFPKPEEQQKVQGHIFQGADRNCPSCNAPMGAKANNCTQCGSPMDGSKEVAGVVVKKLVKPRRAIWPYVLLGIAVLCFGIWWLFIRKKDAQMTLAAHRWETVVAVEKFDNYEDQAWRDQVPADATLPVCISKQRSTKQVPDGEECHLERVDKKDGTFEQLNKCHTKYRSEPVNDDWCTFHVRRWKKVDDAKQSGTGMALTFAAVPDGGASPVLGAKRPGARTQKLVLDFGKAGTCEVDDKTWRKYSDGQAVKLEVRARSGAIVCGSL